MSKKCLAVLLAIVMLFAFAATAYGFTDTNNHWAASAITKWSDAGVVKGYTDGTFKPDANITRAEFAAMLNRILKFTGSSGSFNDVKADAWYYKDVMALAKAGVVNGYSDGTFRPNNPITREEASAMFARAFGLTAKSTKLPFSDADKVSAWALSSVAAMSEGKYINGYPDNTFKPQGLITRAEVVTIINNASGLKAIADYLASLNTPSTPAKPGSSTSTATEKPAVDNIVSIQPYSALTYYGVGLVSVEITYEKDVDLSKVDEDTYIIEDRGNLTPDFGEIPIADVSVKGRVVTITFERDTTANSKNALIYAGDEAKEGAARSKDNVYGLNVTSSWYRELDGDIVTGTAFGYQFRENELQLRHYGEKAAKALCQADEDGVYDTDRDNKFEETEIEYFSNVTKVANNGKPYTKGGFMTLEELGINIPSSSGIKGDYVKAYVAFPKGYDPAKEYPLILSMPGYGTALWELTKDGKEGSQIIASNPYGCTFFDGSAINWYATNSQAIVIYMDHRYQSQYVKNVGEGGEFDPDISLSGYTYVEDDKAVIDYFIDNYNAKANHVILTGNSMGTQCSSNIIKNYPGLISTFICCNGGFGGFTGGYTPAQLATIAQSGLSLWVFDGEYDTDNNATMVTTRAAYKAAGFSDAEIADMLRITGIPAEYNYYWGETDHSATKFVYWYLFDDDYDGPDGVIKNGELTYAKGKALADGAVYHIDGPKADGKYTKADFDYVIYPESLKEWALDTDREIDSVPPTPVVYPEPLVLGVDTPASAGKTPLAEDWSPNQLPLTGYFSANLSGDFADREIRYYIPETAILRPYFHFIAIDNDVDVDEFLVTSGWQQIADETGECLFILLPDQATGKWGTLADEVAYITAARSYHQGGGAQFFTTFGMYYLEGYGAGAAPLEAWAAVNPHLVNAQAYVDGQSAGKAYLDAAGAAPFGWNHMGDGDRAVDADGKQVMLVQDAARLAGVDRTWGDADGQMLKKDMLVPTWLINYGANNASLTYWKGVNKAAASDVGPVYEQTEISWPTEYSGNISKVVTENNVATSGYAFNKALRDAVTDYTRYDNSISYGNGLNYRMDYTAIQVKHFAQADTTKATTGAVEGIIRNGNVVKGQMTLVTIVDEYNYPADVLIYVPESAPATKIPVVTVWHGASQNAHLFTDSTMWWQVAAENGFAIASVTRTLPANANAANGVVTTGSSEPSRFEAVCDYLAADGRFDMSRIYATGQSMGSVATQKIAEESADRLAAAYATNLPFTGAVSLTDEGDPVPMGAVVGDGNYAYRGLPGFTGTDNVWPYSTTKTDADVDKNGNPDHFAKWIYYWSNAFCIDPIANLSDTVIYKTGDSLNGGTDAVGTVADWDTNNARHRIFNWVNEDGIPVLEWTFSLFEAHNNLCCHAEIAWDFMKNYSLNTTTGARTYSASGFTSATDAQPIAEPEPALSADDIVSVQPKSALTYYGVGLVQIDIQYKAGTDLSGVTIEQYNIEDRGSLTSNFGALPIKSIKVDDAADTVILYVDNNTTANDTNALVQSGAAATGSRTKDDVIGLNVTQTWYRMRDGEIVVGKGGFQIRNNELKLWHDGEHKADALLQSDVETGEYLDGSKILPTEIKYFTTSSVVANAQGNYTQGGFKTLEELGIQIPSSSGIAGDYVKAYVAFPEGYDHSKSYPLLLSLPGGGTALWEITEDGQKGSKIIADNPYGPTFYDGSVINWYANNAQAIVIYMDHRYSSQFAGKVDDGNAATNDYLNLDLEGYNYVKDDKAVIDYFIANYGAKSNHVILTGNSAGTGAANNIIQAYPGFISTFICCNGGYNFSRYDAEDQLGVTQRGGLSVWAFDGEYDTDNIANITAAKAAYTNAGITDVDDKLRLTGLIGEYNWYWGESDHSATKFVYWYLLTNKLYGNGTIDPDTMKMVFDEPSASSYKIEGKQNTDGSFVKWNYTYQVYKDQTLMAWALNPDRELTNDSALKTSDIVSVQPYSELVYYGEGLTKLVITYADGVDLSGLTKDQLNIIDRGNLTSVFGQIPIKSISVNKQVVTVTFDRDTTATADNPLIYAGDNASATARVKDNVYGLNVTQSWYRQLDGTLMTGAGFQVRNNELKIWHNGEAFGSALCQSVDATGEYAQGSKIAPTIRQYFDDSEVVVDADGNYTAGGFKTLAELGINIPSSSGLANDYVKAYVAFPEGYDHSKTYPILLSLPGAGTALWEKTEGKVAGKDGGVIIAENPYGPTFYDGSVINWYANDAQAIVIYMDHRYSSEYAPASSGYSYVVDDMAVIDYFIANYNANANHVILTGNSMGTIASNNVIQAYPGRISTFICCNGRFAFPDYSADNKAAAAAKGGLSVWAFDGELDSADTANIARMDVAEAYYEAAGFTPDQIADKLRLTGIAKEYNYYWGESDHSATKFVYWYLLTDKFYGNGVVDPVDQDLNYIDPTATEYSFNGRLIKGEYVKAAYPYQVYTDQTLMEWALNPAREISVDRSELTVDDVVSVQPYSAVSYYGEGLVEVVIQYKAGTDLSKVDASQFNLYDRGSLTSNFGPLPIAEIEVDDDADTVTVIIDRNTTANDSNALVYSGVDATGGRTKDDVFGLNVTQTWYRELDGDIVVGNGGFQYRDNELLFWHDGEGVDDALLQSDPDTGAYLGASNVIKPTEIEYLTNTERIDNGDYDYNAGGFSSFEFLGINIPSTSGIAGDYVKGIVAFPKGYDPNKTYPILLSMPGAGTALWEKTIDGQRGSEIIAENPLGCCFYDASAFNWYDQGANAIIIYMDHRYSSQYCPNVSNVTDLSLPGYNYIKDDKAVIDYFIANYGADANHVILTGNSMGTACSSNIIKAYPKAISTFICVNGGFGGFGAGYTAEELAEIASYGLSLWVFDGEYDTDNYAKIAAAKTAYKAAGYSDEEIADKLRITGIQAEYNYYWGESDHSATKFVYWYLLNSKFYGNGDVDPDTMNLVFDSKTAPTYGFEGKKNADGSYLKASYVYPVYTDQTLMTWALNPDRALVEKSTLTTDDIEAVFPFSELCYYGMGLSSVRIQYKAGTDLSNVTAGQYILKDRGNLTSDYGKLPIDYIYVDDATDTVILYIDRDTTANASNSLIYSGDNGVGARTKDNVYGMNVTQSWYRQLDGALKTGAGFQVRDNELLLWHNGEQAADALVQSDATTGKYLGADNVIRPTVRKYFDDSTIVTDPAGNYTQGGFKTLEELDIDIASSSGIAGDCVKAYVAFPEGYDHSKSYPVLLSLPGAGTALWEKTEGKVAGIDGGVIIAENPYGPTFYDGSVINWYANDAQAIVIYMDHRYSSEYAPASKGYSYVADDMAVIDYFIDNYNANANHVILTGNSMGTIASNAVIQANPGRISTFICCNGGFRFTGYTEAQKNAVLANGGLSVWAFDGELDSDNIAAMTAAEEAYAAAGFTEAQIDDQLRLSGIAKEYNYYWGETDHSATKFVYWYMLTDKFYGNGVVSPADQSLVFDDEDAATYSFNGKLSKGAYIKAAYDYQVYTDQTLMEWALDPAREITVDRSPLTKADVVSVQPYSAVSYYGEGLVKVVIQYKATTDLSNVSINQFNLMDRGSLTSEFGFLPLADIEVDNVDKTVTLIIDRDTTANADNALVTGGTEKTGARTKDDVFGLNVTQTWYRDEAGAIVVGNGGFQYRDNELMLWHDGEGVDDALLQSNPATGEYVGPTNVIKPTDMEFFTGVTIAEEGDGDKYNVGGFSTFEALDIDVASTSGIAGDCVKGIVAFPKNYDPAKKYPILLSMPGAGTALWEKTIDGQPGSEIIAQNPYGCCFYDGSAMNWYDEGAQAIIIYMDHRYSSQYSPNVANVTDLSLEGYNYIKDDKAVIDYFIDHYGVDANHVILTGNSMGTACSSNIIQSYPNLISTFISCNGTVGGMSGFWGGVGYNEAQLAEIASYGLSVWIFDGEYDTNNIANYNALKAAYKAAGYSDAEIADKLRITGLQAEYNYYWGESDHSATKFVYWYLLNSKFYGNGHVDPATQELVFDSKTAKTYGFEGTKAADGSYAKQGFEYPVYTDQTLMDWALNPDRALQEKSSLTTEMINQVQPGSELCYYGEGLAWVRINYATGTDLSNVTADQYILQDRGNLTPEFGTLPIKDIYVDEANYTVTLYIDRDTTAAAENALVYSGDNATGSRVKNNVYGLNVTSSWYRELDGDIVTGAGGYQYRDNELTLRHVGEPVSATLYQSDDKGEYIVGSKIKPTEVEYFYNVGVTTNAEADGDLYTVGGFLTLEELGIDIQSSSGIVGDFVKAYVAFPVDYDESATDKYPILLSLPGGGTALWEKTIDGQPGSEIIAENPYGPTFFDGSVINWYANDAKAIVIYMDHRYSSQYAPAVSDGNSATRNDQLDLTLPGYNYVKDDMAVIDYFIDNYNVDAGHVILTGNSAGTNASNMVIQAYPERISTFICCNGTFGFNNYAAEIQDRVVATGLSVWAFDGELDSNNIGSMGVAEAAYEDEGMDPADYLRHTGIAKEYNYYYGETDHSATKFVYWYLLTDAFKGNGFVHPVSQALVFDDAAATEYSFNGKLTDGTYVKAGYNYQVYSESLMDWALDDAREIVVTP